MHPQNSLPAIIAGLPLIKLRKTLHRVVDSAALNSLSPMVPLYTLGPGRNGQRYTPRGGPNAIYAAEDQVTALAEYHQISRIALVEGNASKTASNPTSNYAIEVSLTRVLDLSNPDIQQALGTSVKELTGPWRPQMIRGIFCPTHVIASAVFANGSIQAMRYPSARDSQFSCLIIWEDRIQDPSFIEVVDSSGILSARIPPK